MWGTGAGTISFVSNVYSNGVAATAQAVVKNVTVAAQSIGTGQGSQTTQNFFFGTDEQQDQILGGIISDAIVGGSVGGVASKVSGGLRATNTASLTSRAREINKLLDPIAQNRRTTAVLETSNGRIVSSGGRDLSSVQLDVLLPDEIASMRAPGVHAEIKAIESALGNGVTLME